MSRAHTPQFDLPRQSWSLLNHFETGDQQQTMNRMVNTCPVTKFGGGLLFLHEAGNDVIPWLECVYTAAMSLAKRK